MDSMEKLRTGVAYHGNRMLHHVQSDMKDIVEKNMNLVVHMFSHTDWDRHEKIMAEIIALSEDAGLEVWVDNWGLAGPPGDKSHFLGYYPDSHLHYGNGQQDPVRPCLNSPDFRSFTKEWIDTVQSIGGKSIFWDEPHLPLKEMDGVTYASCVCPRCQKLFEDLYHQPMPAHLTAEVNDFRIHSIVDYFQEVTAYSDKKGLENIVCVMLGAHHGISLETIDRIANLDTLTNIGSDPYWVDHRPENVYEFVYNKTKENLAICEKYHKQHNLWIQAFDNPRGQEEDIVIATEAAYDAGARTILAWGYYGCISNDYRSENPALAWHKTGEAMARIWDRERTRIRKENRRRMGL